MWVTWLFQPPNLLCQANRIPFSASGFGESGKGIQLVSQHKWLISTAYPLVNDKDITATDYTAPLGYLWCVFFGLASLPYWSVWHLKPWNGLVICCVSNNPRILWLARRQWFNWRVPRSSIQDMTTSRPYCLETLWPLATAMLGYPELDWMPPFRIHIQLYIQLYIYNYIYIIIYICIYIYVYIYRQCEGTAWTNNAWTFFLTFHPWKNGVWISEYLWGRTFPSCPTQAWFVGWSLAFILDWKISITQCNASGVECEDSSGYRLGRSEIRKVL